MRYKGQSIDEIAERVNRVRCNVFRYLAIHFDPEPESGDTEPIGGEIRDGRGAGEGGNRL